MPGPARHRRIIAIVVASAAAHMAILVVLAFQHPRLRGQALPPPIFDVTMVPLYLVEPSARTRQREAPPPIRPRRARLPVDTAPVAPLYAPSASSGTPSNAGVSLHPAPQPPGTQAQIGQALRLGGVGCPNPDAAGLSKAERERCLERLGAGSKSASYLGQGLSRDKQRLLDQAAATKEAYRKYRDAPMPPGLQGSDAAGGISGLGESKPTTEHRF